MVEEAGKVMSECWLVTSFDFVTTVKHRHSAQDVGVFSF